MKRFGVLTIFPDLIRSYTGESIIKRAVRAGLITVDVYNLRDFTADRHKTVDDYPYGGGPGMVMKPGPFFSAVETLWPDRDRRRILLLSPQGRLFSDEMARDIALDDRETVLLCGRYEAVDERVRALLADEEISIGDYVLTGGELAALVIIDAVSRFVPGVLGDIRSSEEDSFSGGLLDYPHYTRPEEFRGMSVPQVLLSGNHAEIARWRRKQALRKTGDLRPDLIERLALSEDDKKLLNEIREEGR